MLRVDLEALRDDPKALFAAASLLKRQALEAIDREERLEHRLEQELKARYGQRSERGSLLGSAGQGLMPFLADALTASAPPSPSPATPLPTSVPAPRAKHPGRRPLPANLERRQRLIELAPEDRLCPCCQEPMPPIGADRSERLEYVPATFLVLEEVRPKYACPRCQEGVLTALPSPAPIAKGLPGPGLLAHVAVSKFADHLPLHRQELIFDRLGFEISRSTLCGWIAEVARLLEPIRDVLLREILASGVVHADETKVPVQAPGEKKTHTSWLWTYLTGGPQPATVFDYTRSRGNEGPVGVLGDYKGFLLTDGYSGYAESHRRGAVEVGCWAHARRYFVEARTSDPPRCNWMIERIGRLYAVEDAAREMTPEARAVLRREHAGPILGEIHAWLEAEVRTALPRSAVGEAIAYARNRWAALTRYVEDGRLEIDNNRAERAMRQVVLGRRNWTFAGSDEGGRRAAIIFSVIATCKANGVEPWAYLKDVLERLPTYRGDVAALTPVAWKRAREAAVAPKG